MEERRNSLESSCSLIWGAHAETLLSEHTHGASLSQNLQITIFSKRYDNFVVVSISAVP